MIRKKQILCDIWDSLLDIKLQLRRDRRGRALRTGEIDKPENPICDYLPCGYICPLKNRTVKMPDIGKIALESFERGMVAGTNNALDDVLIIIKEEIDNIYTLRDDSSASIILGNVSDKIKALKKET